MKKIVTKHFPFKGFVAINIFGILFIRKEYKNKINKIVINHENIHTEQMKELGYIFFYLWYFIEWLIRWSFSRDKFTHNAYRHISFEREAYDNESYLNYLEERESYEFIKYLN